MFGKDKDKQKKKKEKTNGKAGHSEENYNILYDNLAFPEVYAKEQKQSDTEETDEEPVNYDNVAIPEINVKKDKKYFRPLLMSGSACRKSLFLK